MRAPSWPALHRVPAPGTVAEPLCLLAGWALLAAGDTFQPYMLAGLAALALPWWLRARAGCLRRTPVDGALAVFAGTALLGVLTAYDPAIAGRQCGLVLVSVAGFYTLVHWCDSPRRLELAGAGGVAGVLALGAYFVTQRDWSAAPVKFAPVAWVGRAINAAVPNLRLHAPHANIVAGVLLIGLLLAAGRAWQARGRARAGWLLALALLAAALIMTMSRGSGLALAGTAALWLAARVLGRRRPGAARGALALAVPGLFGASLAAVALFPGAVDPLVEAVLGAGDQGALRTGIWAASGALARDYVYTGGGLGMFPMLYGAYAQPVPGPLVPHAHNLYLTVAIEQGLLGACALVWLLARTALHVWQCGAPAHPLGRAALWAALAMALLWMVDTMPYADRAAGFMFVPVGMAWAAYRVAGGRDLGMPGGAERGMRGAVCCAFSSTSHSALRTLSPLARYGVILSTVVYVLLVMALAGDPLAAAYANAGALAQARAELEAYRVMAQARDWPDCEALARERGWTFGIYLSCARVPDAVALAAVRRRAGTGIAEEWYARALARAPGNATAHERLGMLALARGDVAGALAELRAGGRSAAARLLLADALVAAGRVGEGVAAARAVEGAAEYFAHVAWRRDLAGGAWRRAVDGLAAAAALAPERAEWLQHAHLMRALYNFYYISDKY